MTEAKPTKGPWIADMMDGAHHPRVTNIQGVHIAEIGNAEAWIENKDRWESDARIIAVSGTTAHELREVGIDGEELIRLMPEIAFLLEMASEEEELENEIDNARKAAALVAKCRI